MQALNTTRQLDNEAFRFLEENPRIVDNLTELFGKDFWSSIKYDVVNGISKNTLLFNKYARSQFKKYYNVYEAIYQTSEKDTLIYFADLKLYAVVDSLTDLMDNYNTGCKTEDDIEIYQIITEHGFGFITTNTKLNYLINYALLDVDLNNSKDKFQAVIKKIKSITDSDYNIKRLTDDIDRTKQLLKVSKSPQVYFIVEEPFLNRVKIGKSYDCEKRLKQLQTGSPQRLKIYHKTTTLNNSILEMYLHNKYKDRRIQGEWFKFTRRELNEAVDELD